MEAALWHSWTNQQTTTSSRQEAPCMTFWFRRRLFPQTSPHWEISHPTAPTVPRGSKKNRERACNFRTANMRILPWAFTSKKTCDLARLKQSRPPTASRWARRPPPLPGMISDRSSPSFPCFLFLLPSWKSEVRTFAGSPWSRLHPTRLPPQMASPGPARTARILRRLAAQSLFQRKSLVFKSGLPAAARSQWSGPPRTRSSFPRFFLPRLNSRFLRPRQALHLSSSLCGTLWARPSREATLQNGRGLHPNELLFDEHTMNRRATILTISCGAALLFTSATTRAPAQEAGPMRPASPATLPVPMPVNKPELPPVPPEEIIRRFAAKEDEMFRGEAPDDHFGRD